MKMICKRSVGILFAAMFLFSVSLPAEPVVIAAGDLKLKTPPMKKESYTSSLVTRKTGEQVIRFVKTSKKDYCGFYLSPPERLPDFDRIAVEFRLAETAPLENFTLRLIDSDGENLQYKWNGPEIKNGTIRFLIDRHLPPDHSWGKKKNGRIDFPVSLSGGTFRFQNGDGILEMKEVALEILEPYTEPPELSLCLPEHGFAFLNPADQNGEMILRNKSERPVRASLSFSVADWNGNAAEEKSGIYSLNGKESRKIPFKIPLQYGVYRVKYWSVLLDGTKQTKEGEFRFASIRLAKAGERTGGEFLFGICSQHLPHLTPELMRKEIAAAAAAGAGIIRFCSYWDIMEKKKDRWDFAPLDRVFSTMEQHGMKSQILHSRLPKWAVAKNWKPVSNRKRPGRALPDFNAWRRFNRVFAERYAGRCAYIEIWNEPDLFSFADFSTEDYLTLLQIAAQEIRKADSNVKILSGGFATLYPPSASNGNRDIVLRTMTEGKNNYDVFASHNHGTLLTSCRLELNRYEKLKNQCGDSKPWYLNEAGLSSRNYSEMVQAAETFRKPLFCWSRGIMGYNWYNLRNDGNDRLNKEHNFGLLLHNFQPKPSYLTFNMLTELYGHAKWIRTVADNQNFTVLEFQNAGTRLFAHWHNLHRFRKQTLLFGNVSGKASLVDLFGNERELAVKDGVVRLEVGEYPSTLKIAGQKEEPVYCGEMFRFHGNTTFLPGKEERALLEVFNPSVRESTVRFRFETEKSLNIRPEKGVLRIPARSSRKIAVRVLGKGEGDFSDGNRLCLALGAQAEEAFPLPFEFVHAPSSDHFPEEPDYVLNRVEQVSIQVPSDPEHEPYVWKGTADLSGRIFLMLNRKEFRLKVEVTDDIHSQKFSGEELWRGDSIQFAIVPLVVSGFWRFGLSLRPDGKGEIFLWDSPLKMNAVEAVERTRLTVSRNEKDRKTVYEFSAPSGMLGIDRHPFRFNLLLNDNDGEFRESFISIVPGLGRGWTPDLFPLLKSRN